MDGDFTPSFWQGNEFWTTLGFPTILFFIALLGMIWRLIKRQYKKPIWCIIFILVMVGFLIGATSIMYIAVELVRAGQLEILNIVNNLLSANPFIIGAFALIVLYHNRNPFGGLPLIMTLTFPAIITYARWLTNLAIWYAQAYF